MKITLNKILAFFIATMTLTTSCQKDKQEEILNSGKGTVTLKIGGTSFANGVSNVGSKSSTNNNSKISSPATQQQEVSFNEEYNVTATLTPVVETTSNLRAATRAESVSTGPVKEALEIGTTYYIKVYEKGNRNRELTSKNFTHGINDQNIEFDLPSGEYTFVAAGQSPYNNPLYTYNPLHWKEDIVVIEGKNTIINLTFTHLFAEVTVTLNAGTIGNIEKINGGYIVPMYSINEGDGGKIDYFTGAVTFGTYQGSNNLVFPTQPLGSLWKSRPASLQVKYTDKGEVELFGVTINGIMGNIHLSNLIFEEGVKYDLQLTLGQKTERTYKIGNVEFAMSNLFYDQSKNTHYFLARDNGSYFFANYVKPKKMGVLNSKPSTDINGQNGDPCKLVKPLNTWRLPTDTEIKTVFSELNITSSSNSNQNIYYTQKGIAFGTRQNLGNDPMDYLFLYFSGFYQGSDRNYNNEYYHLTKIGRYLLTKASGGYARLEISYTPTNNSAETKIQLLDAPDLDNAISVRCVKN